MRKHAVAGRVCTLTATIALLFEIAKTRFCGEGGGGGTDGAVVCGGGGRGGRQGGGGVYLLVEEASSALMDVLDIKRSVVKIHNSE